MDSHCYESQALQTVNTPGIYRLPRLQQLITVASGEGKLDDLEFAFSIEKAQDGYTGTLMIVDYARKLTVRSSKIQLFYPISSTRLVAIFLLQNEDRLSERELVLFASEQNQEQKDSFYAFSPPHLSEAQITYGGELSLGSIQLNYQAKKGSGSDE